MIATWSAFRSFDRPSQVLMVNQFTINLGFYMLMPYLSGYLSVELALAGWAVGLILGIRNFSQQGMFLIGGTLADRLGYKPLIVAGCILRTAGFALLATSTSLGALIAASAATGFAGALFNPAVRAYLAADAKERRVEAFATFNIFYQAGIVLGPLVGLALMAIDFQATSLAAAAVFGVLSIIQIVTLPRDRREPPTETDARQSILQDWRTVVRNRPFTLFAAAMIGSYVLSFQVYLVLPLQADHITTNPHAATALVAGVFVVTGVIAVLGQLRITAWLRARTTPMRSIVAGLIVMGASFLPPLLVPTADTAGTAAAAIALLASAAGLAVATAAVFPFEMDTVVTLSRDRLVATHYGLYNTIVGVGILIGNLATGALFSVATDHGMQALMWAALVLIGVLSAWAVHRLSRRAAFVPA
ncbi:MAG: MFS transporter [Gordonia polyisoprenivorans]|nr:MFS transporter [Gordonia polyisoprenivorans]